MNYTECPEIHVKELIISYIQQIIRQKSYIPLGHFKPIIYSHDNAYLLTGHKSIWLAKISLQEPLSHLRWTFTSMYLNHLFDFKKIMLLHYV